MPITLKTLIFSAPDFFWLPISIHNEFKAKNVRRRRKILGPVQIVKIPRNIKKNAFTKTLIEKIPNNKNVTLTLNTKTSWILIDENNVALLFFSEKMI